MTTAIWLLLMAATAVSWWLGARHGIAVSAARTMATTGVMVISFVKVKMIVSYFMEVRNAPILLRVACDAWIGLVLALILGLYFFLPH